MAFRSNALAITAVLAVFVAPAQADTVSALTAILKQSQESPNPVMTFLTNFRPVRNYRANQAQIREALARAGIPGGSALDSVLRSTREVRKRGATVSLTRSGATLLPLGNEGVIRLGSDVSFDLSQSRDRAFQFSNVKGIHVGEDARNLYKMKKLRYNVVRGRPVVNLEVKAGWLTIKREFVLPRFPRVTAARPARTDRDVVVANAETSTVPLPRPNPRRGMTAALGDALDNR